MKLKLWSDLHLEFRNYSLNGIWTPAPEDKETVLLLAGDIGCGIGGKDLMGQLANAFKAVIRICGNHEFYDNNFQTLIAQWKEIEDEMPDNFHFLHNDWRIIDGVKFIGGTMWTDYHGGDPFAVGAATRIMYDFRVMRESGKPISAAWVIAQHDEFTDFFFKEIEKDFDGKIVVVTHHSPGSIYRSAYGHGLIEFAYFADLEDAIGYHDKVALWVHGHTHANADYLINNTRVVCNPLGYKKEANTGFDPNLILEV